MGHAVMLGRRSVRAAVAPDDVPGSAPPVHAGVNDGEEALPLRDPDFASEEDVSDLTYTVEDADAEFEAVLALAREPLPLPEPEDAPEPEPELVPEDVLASLEALPGVDFTETDQKALMLALEALQAAHRSTTEGVVALVASAVRDRDGDRGDQIALTAIEALRAFATRPVPGPSPITVNVPQHDVHVDATVHVPEQAAPIVNVAAAEAPVVNVTVPQEAPSVHVTLPEQHVDVHVPAPHVDVHVPPQNAARAVRVEFDAQGNKRFVVEDGDPE